MCVCVCVCVQDKERERERETNRQRQNAFPLLMFDKIVVIQHEAIWEFKNCIAPNEKGRTFLRFSTLKNLIYHHHHHHHIVLLARISLTLSRYFSLSFIASGRSSGLHPISSHSCCMYVRASRAAFARPYWGSIGVHHLWARPCFSSSVRHVCFVYIYIHETCSQNKI